MTLRPADEAAREWLNSREGMDGSFSSDDLNFVERIWQASRQEAIEAAAHVAENLEDCSAEYIAEVIRQLVEPAGKREG